MRNETLAKAAHPEVAIVIMLVFVVIFAVVLYRTLRKDSSAIINYAENLPFEEGAKNESE
ncbi:MAG: hypothetical protein Fur0010_27860 [Bdellovibrio sp.]